MADRLVYECARTVVGTISGVLFTCLVAYGLSAKTWCSRTSILHRYIRHVFLWWVNPLLRCLAIARTLEFIRSLLIPSLLNTFFLLIAISFFREIPLVT